MRKRNRRRRRPAWRGQRRSTKPLRERRPYKSRRALARGKTEWWLRCDNKFFWSGDSSELSLAASRILEVLRHFADDGDDPYHWIQISDPDLMYFGNVTRPTVHDAVCNLLEHGCIDGERGGGFPSRYRLTEKVLRFSHGKRKSARVRRRPKQAKPRRKAKRKAAVPAEAADVRLEMPEDLAAEITPAAWREITQENPSDHILDAILAYKNLAAQQRIRTPPALFHYLLDQSWLVGLCAKIREKEHGKAALAARQRADAEKLRKERDAYCAQVKRKFTKSERDEFSELALSIVRECKFSRHAKVGGLLWRLEMLRLIEQDGRGTTEPENETDGPDETPDAAETSKEPPAATD